MHVLSPYVNILDRLCILLGKSFMVTFSYRLFF